jgi:cation diffusion facilitator CzcD-associated flavoprotein CzcO
MKVAIVGSGFAGLGMAIRLKQQGHSDFVVLEQAEGVGGTWRANHYPGAACDVQSHLYSFSFAPHSDWTRMFAPQREILDYLERCADRFGLRSQIRCGAGVRRAVFDERRGLWSIELESGERIEAHALVTACGGLSRPAYPEIAGLETFAGKVYHSARWDDSDTLDGLRVGMIGTGASAIQIVPAIAERVGKLSIFQRSAPWILPKPDHEISPRQRERFRRVPALQRLARLSQYLQHEVLALGFIGDPRIMRWAQRLALRHLEASIRRPDLRNRLVPSYTMGCKRVLLSNDYYPALERDNVELVTDAIERVVPEGIVTSDGRLHKLDRIVLATGFQAAEAVAPFEVRGRNGRDLRTEWHAGAEAYLGTTVSGFPNLFMIIGPNTTLGHSSMVLMIESQIRYILGCLELMQRRALSWVDIKPEVQRRYNAELTARLERTVWASGCTSWYRTKSGKNTTLWPGFTFEFWQRTRRFDLACYECRALPVGDFAPAPSVSRHHQFRPEPALA